MPGLKPLAFTVHCSPGALALAVHCSPSATYHAWFEALDLMFFIALKLLLLIALLVA